MTTITVPLSKLRLSPLNVRQHVDGTAAADTSDLEASIPTVGLLSPLIVHHMTKPKGHFGVLAGGRRLRAMQALAARGVLADDHPVEAIVRDEDAATSTELSVIENTARVALSPAQEFRAFATLKETGADETVIAERFGVTILHVRQRMRLGELHPDILEALDAGRINLDAAKVYASTSDQVLQKRVFDVTGGYARQPYEAQRIRGLMKAARSAYDLDAMLQFVGEDAYRAAGGVLEEDLFNPGTFDVLHPGTLSELYYAKLEKETVALKAKLPQGVEVTTSSAELGQWIEAEPQLTDEQRGRVAEIDGRSTVIEDELEQLIDGWSADGDKPIAFDAEEQERVDRLDAQRRELAAEKERIEADAPVDIAGPAVLLVKPGSGGLAQTGYYRPAGWRPDAAAPGLKSASSSPSAKPVASQVGLDSRLGCGDNPQAAVKDQHGLTADAIEVNRSHRRAILRGMMVSQDTASGRRTAGDFLTFTTLRLTLQRSGARGNVVSANLGVASGTGSTAGSGVVEGLQAEVDAQPCQQIWAGVVDGFAHVDWMAEPDLRVAFARFNEQPGEDRDLAMAVAAGIVLDRSLRAPGYAVPVHDQLAFLLGMESDQEVRRLWRPNAAFFDRLPKGRRLAAVEEVNRAAAKKIGNLASAEVSAACERFFRADRAAVREFNMRAADVPYAQRWLPEFLRFEDSPRGPRLAEQLRGDVAEQEAVS